MKKGIILIVILFNCCKLDDPVIKIKILSVDFATETFAKTSCDDFEKDLGGRIKTKIIADEKRLNEFNSFFNSLTIDTAKNYPNVRMKIYIYKRSNQVDTLCLNGGSIAEFNRKSMIVQPNFINYVRKISK